MSLRCCLTLTGLSPAFCMRHTQELFVFLCPLLTRFALSDSDEYQACGKIPAPPSFFAVCRKGTAASRTG